MYVIIFTGNAINQDELLEVMPAVEEANSISEELDKKVKFEIVVVAPQILGKNHGNSEVSSTDFLQLSSS